MNPYTRKHRREQSSFVLAVAIAIAKDVSCKMRLKAANAHLNSKVANLLLNKLRNRFRLVIKIGLAGGEFVRLGRDLRRDHKTVLRQRLIPLADALPRTIGGRWDTGARIMHCHAPGKRQLRGTKENVIEIDGWDV